MVGDRWWPTAWVPALLKIEYHLRQATNNKIVGGPNFEPPPSPGVAFLPLRLVILILPDVKKMTSSPILPLDETPRVASNKSSMLGHLSSSLVSSRAEPGTAESPSARYDRLRLAQTRTLPQDLTVNVKWIKLVCFILLVCVSVMSFVTKGLFSLHFESSRPTHLAGWELISGQVLVPNLADSHSHFKSDIKIAPADKKNIPNKPVVGKSSSTSEFTLKYTDASPVFVLVTSLNREEHTQEYTAKILQNRKEYAKAYNYGVYARYLQDFEDHYRMAHDHTTSWGKIALCRAAMAAFPNAEYFWFLDSSAIIMNPEIDIYEHIISAERLDKFIQHGTAIVRKKKTDSADFNPVVTSKTMKADTARLIFVQDEIGLSSRSFVFKNDPLASTFLEFWDSTQFKTYSGFDRQESSALNHLAQWHSTFLSKMAIIPPKTIASMSASNMAELLYTDGDFVCTFDCRIELHCFERFEAFWTGRSRVPEEFRLS